jgi:hypothetical protein
MVSIVFICIFFNVYFIFFIVVYWVDVHIS